jgi:predicted PurR-regulated permease PerM
MRLDTLESRVFLVLVLATTAFFLWMVRLFLPAVFWAVIFAVLFQPVYLRTKHRVGGRPALAAALTTVAVVMVVLVPASFLVTAVAQQGLSVYQRILAGDINLDRPIEIFERSVPQLAEFLDRYGIEPLRVQTWFENAAVIGSQWIGTQLLAVGQNAMSLGVLFFLMLYVLFFLFRDGEKIVRGLIRALPMGDEREERLFHRFAQVARATVKGTLVVAIVQGVVGGLLFVAAGIEAALFWGLMMGLLSILPAVGPALIWGPASIYLLFNGNIVGGLILLIGGAIAVSLADNVLRPVLVGRETKMPDYLILIATLGGLMAFGIAGFVAGPVIAALFLVMWEMFADEYAPHDSSAPFTKEADADPPATETPVAEPAAASSLAGDEQV